MIHLRVAARCRDDDAIGRGQALQEREARIRRVDDGDPAGDGFEQRVPLRDRQIRTNEAELRFLALPDAVTDENHRQQVVGFDLLGEPGERRAHGLGGGALFAGARLFGQHREVRGLDPKPFAQHLGESVDPAAMELGVLLLAGRALHDDDEAVPFRGRDGRYAREQSRTASRMTREKRSFMINISGRSRQAGGPAPVRTSAPA